MSPICSLESHRITCYMKDVVWFLLPLTQTKRTRDAQREKQQQQEQILCLKSIDLSRPQTLNTRLLGECVARLGKIKFNIIIRYEKRNRNKLMFIIISHYLNICVLRILWSAYGRGVLSRRSRKQTVLQRAQLMTILTSAISWFRYSLGLYNLRDYTLSKCWAVFFGILDDSNRFITTHKNKK